MKGLWGMEYFGIGGILISVCLLMFLAYKDKNLYFATLVCAFIVIVTNGIDIWDGMQNGYAVALGDFVSTYLYIFIIGVLFGEVMKDSGIAEVLGYKIANIIGVQNAMIGVVLINFIMGTIGVSGYVLVFCTVPICRTMFKRANLPMSVMPAAQLLGCALGAGVLPYNPILNNVIPATYLGTSLGAQPLLGVIAFLLLAIPGCLYCKYIGEKAKNKMSDKAKALVEIEEFEAEYSRKDKPNLLQCLIPCSALVLIIIMFDNHFDSNKLVAFSITIGTLLVFILNWKRLLQSWNNTVSNGLNQGAGAIMLAATVMGFAGVVQMTPAFGKLVEWCLNINLHPYLTESISINLLAGVTGSAAAGIQIFMQTFANSFLSMGMDAAVMHRLAPIASFGLNTLPHNATVVLSLKYMNVTYKESYGSVIITTIILPTLSSILTTLIAIAYFR